jgi:hypothetical protein
MLGVVSPACGLGRRDHVWRITIRQLEPLTKEKIAAQLNAARELVNVKKERSVS